jgi:hypothetical protein
MKFNFKKNWYYLVPVVIGAYLIYRQFAKKNDPKSDAPILPTPPITPAPTSDFPLKRGSKNKTVETLQELLNIGLQANGSTLLVVDGDFGGKTLAALQEIYEEDSIANQAQLDNLRSVVNDQNWGNKLMNAYNTHTFSYLLVKTPIKLIGYTKNFEGLWTKNGKNLTLPAKKYNLNDYAVKGVASDGTLRIQIMNGALAGTYYSENGDLKSTFDIV